jgi:hypothetical protein
MWFYLKYNCRCEDMVEHADQVYVSAVSIDDDFEWMFVDDYFIVWPD